MKAKKAELLERNISIRNKYLSLRKAKTKRDDALKTIISELEKEGQTISKYTIMEIVSCPRYSNSPLVSETT